MIHPEKRKRERREVRGEGKKRDKGGTSWSQLGSLRGA